MKNLFYGGYIAADCLPFDMTTQTKDLGIIVSNNECFGEQVEAVITKGKGCRDGYYLTDLQNPSKAPYDDTLQVSCAVGHGHGSVLLHGMVSRCIGTGEKAGVGSRYFRSKISDISHSDYRERLKILGLYSLERRGERYVIIYTMKILKGLVPNFSDDSYKLKTYIQCV